jgi:tripartite-type tricarboxylate transporter receptor subunit TctC
MKATACALTAALAVVLAGAAPLLAAEEWPTRPIRIVTATPAGSSPDFVGRLLAERLAKRLGQPVIVENSGSTIVATWNGVAKSEPNGYLLTLLTGGFTARAAVAKSLPFDSLRDFAAITLVSGYPMVVSVARSSPILSFPDLLQRAKAAPGKLTFAMNLPGSVMHLLGELINIEGGTAMTGVAYRASNQALTDVLGGRVDAIIDTGTFTFPQIRGGSLRGLAVSSRERFALMPDIPTIHETLPGIDVTSWLGLAAAAGTPRPIVERLNREMRASLAEPDIRERLASVGNTPMPSTPDEMQQRIASEIARWSKVVEERKIERY